MNRLRSCLTMGVYTLAVVVIVLGYIFLIRTSH